VPERPNGTVLKTVVVNSYRGFKSHRFLQMKPQTYKSGVFSLAEAARGDHLGVSCDH
jgi:hypothetical protein